MTQLENESELNIESGYTEGSDWLSVIEGTLEDAPFQTAKGDHLNFQYKN